MTEVIELAAAPGTGAIYRRAALGQLRRRSATGLPDTTLVLRGLAVDRAHLAAYNRVCGYRLTDQLVNSAKELVLTVRLQQALTQLQAAEVTGKQDRREVRNDMAFLSARSIGVEETSRMAGGINDPARMVTSFPGVVRGVLGPVVLLAQVVDVGCWWLARVPHYGPTFALAIMGTGAVVGLGLALQIVLSLLNMYGATGKLLILLLLLGGGAGVGYVGLRVVQPALDEERKTAIEKARPPAPEEKKDAKADQQANNVPPVSVS